MYYESAEDIQYTGVLLGQNVYVYLKNTKSLSTDTSSKSINLQYN